MTYDQYFFPLYCEIVYAFCFPFYQLIIGLFLLFVYSEKCYYECLHAIFLSFGYIIKNGITGSYGNFLFMEKNFFPPLSDLRTFVQNQLNTDVGIYFWALNTIPMFERSIT